MKNNLFSKVGSAMRRGVLAIVALVALVLGGVAQAQTNSYTFVNDLITGPQQYFNTALTWVVGAVGVLMIIGWIRRAMRGR